MELVLLTGEIRVKNGLQIIHRSTKVLLKKNKEKTLKGETNTKKEEWIVDNAAQYFFNEGINEDGVNIFIEELGLEEFVSFVEDLFTDTHLTVV